VNYDNAAAPTTEQILGAVSSDGNKLAQPATPPTPAQIATGIFQDTTAGDFTVKGSFGIGAYTGLAPGGTGGLATVGSQMDLVDAPNAKAVTAMQKGLSTLSTPTGWPGTWTVPGTLALADITSDGKKIDQTGASFTAIPNLDTKTSLLATAADLKTANDALSNATYGLAKLARPGDTMLVANCDVKASTLATAKDLATAQGTLTKLETTWALDAGAYRFTALALALAPTGGAAPTKEQIRAEMDANSIYLKNADVATSTRATKADVQVTVKVP
jgi:hypothetical protein